MDKPLDKTALKAILHRCRLVFLELDSLRAKSGQPEMDLLDTELYAESLKPLRTTEQIDLIRREIRRVCKFCPTASELSKMVAELAGTDTVPAHYANSGKIIAEYNAGTSQRLLEGVTPAQAAANRERARAMIASLCEKQAPKRAGKLGEVPDFLKPELDELAKKRKQIDIEFGFAGSEK